MTGAFNYAKRILLEEDGPTATEYAIMLALIIAVAVGAISGIGAKLDTIFTNLSTSLPAGPASLTTENFIS